MELLRLTSLLNSLNRWRSNIGEELMVTYCFLSEQAKESNRFSVRSVFDAVKKAGYGQNDFYSWKTNMEKLAEEVHKSWMEGKREKGITSRKAEDGEELMVPYEN
jgi:hypothetical protein